MQETQNAMNSQRDDKFTLQMSLFRIYL
jgi:hypothetical protein